MKQCYSYLKLIDHNKLIASYSDDIPLTDTICVKPVVLLVSSDKNRCNPYSEYEELDNEDRPMLKALSLVLWIKFVTCDLPQIFESY